MSKRRFCVKLRFASFFVKTGLVIIVALNVVRKRYFFWCKLRFASCCVNTGLFISLSLNLVPKRRFCIKLRFASFSVETVLVITVSLTLVPKRCFLAGNCVFPHFVLKHFHCLSKSSAKTTFLAQSMFCYHFVLKLG